MIRRPRRLTPFKNSQNSARPHWQDPNNKSSEVMFTLYRLPKISNKAYRVDAKHIRQKLEQPKAI